MNKIVMMGSFILMATMLAGLVMADYNYGAVAKLSNETREAIANVTNERLGTNITPEQVGTGVVKEAIQSEKQDIKETVIAYAKNASNMTQAEREAARELIKEDIKNWVSTKKGVREEIRGEINKSVRFDIEDKNVTVQQLTDAQKEIIAEKINARTGLNLSAEDIDNKTVLGAYLSNGKHTLIKVMPDTASERALQRLGLKVCNESRNCTLELKETGSGNETRPVYELKKKVNYRILGFINAQRDVNAQVDAETGNVTSSNKPWWAAISTQSDQ